MREIDEMKDYRFGPNDDYEAVRVVEVSEELGQEKPMLLIYPKHAPHMCAVWTNCTMEGGVVTSTGGAIWLEIRDAERTLRTANNIGHSIGWENPDNYRVLAELIREHDPAAIALVS